MVATSSSTMLLLLADTRLPTGGHAHSFGLEAAVVGGSVSDTSSLAALLVARLGSTVVVDAHAAALACHIAGQTDAGAMLLRLDDEMDARMPSPAARGSSRRQGEQYRRSMERIVGHQLLRETAGSRPPGPHLAVAVGVAATASGLDPLAAAQLAAYSGIAAPASAALRLLGLDPYEVHALLAALAPRCDALAHEAARAVTLDPASLPALSTPGLDHLYELHARRSERLFAS